MNDVNALDRTFHFILKKMVETGQAPHYTEIAAEFDIPVAEGRKALHNLFAQPFPGWLYPETDFITSFAPFNNLPTQYRVSVDGNRKWFGQWGFESLAVCWLFPGKIVEIDFPCLDCGLPIHIEMRDGKILKTDPVGLVGYTSVPYLKWAERWHYTWSTMNIFRSEEHVRNFTDFDPANQEGIIGISDLSRLFSGEMFQKRLEPDYFSRRGEYRAEFVNILEEIGKMRPFWSPGKI